MHRSDNIVTWLLLTSNIINITNITHLLLTFVLLKLLYLPFPAMCTLFYLFIYYIYVCLQNVNFLANKTLQNEKKQHYYINYQTTDRHELCFQLHSPPPPKKKKKN